jgi:hypothetical protein
VAGVVHQDIDTAEFSTRPANNPSTVQRAREIRDYKRSLTQLVDFRRRRGKFGVGSRGQKDGRAFLGKKPRDSAPNPSTRASDECNFVLQQHRFRRIGVT